MTKIDIYSGFLGAGKTTLIKKMIREAYAGQKLVLIENEFGEIGIDGGFLKEAGIEITEMNSGCICCSLVGDFGKALQQVIDQYAPDRILIEPSGVGKLSDVEAAVEKVVSDAVQLGNTVTVVDAKKCKMYMKNFGEFYNNQVETAGTIIMSRTDALNEEKLHATVDLLKEKNPNAVIVTTPWDQLTGEQILAAMEKGNTMLQELEHAHHHAHRHHDHDEHCCDHDHHHHDHDEHCCDHDHHHHDHDEHCCHDHEHHHHDHDDHCCHDHDHHHYGHDEHCCHDHDHHHHDHDEHCCHDHEHHHHDHGDHCCGHEHHHHHDHDEHCTCGCHDHDHHHADEVFTSWGIETPKKFTEEEIQTVLAAFDAGDCGMVLRAKGIVAAKDGQWIHFDYVPGETNLRRGAADVTGRLCVIGAQISEDKLAELFGL